MNYKEFELIDFVLDESFQQWVSSPTPESDKFWRLWLEENPGKKKVINQAKSVLESIDYKKTALSEKDKVDILNDIRAKIKADELTEELRIHSDEVPDDDVDETVIYSLPLRKTKRFYWVPVAAAIFLLLAVIGYWVLFPIGERVIYQTAYGETEHIDLPDGSRLVLNANSSISYQSNWDDKQDREVELEGEAFFTITHTPDHQKFIVHSNNVEIEVLGTEFNVNNRRGKSQVVLQSGKVKVNLKQTRGKESELDDMLIMEPGDLVEVSDKDTKITKKVVTPENYSSWTNGILIFNKMPLSEVFEMIQDNYGYNVIVLEEGIEQRLFTAEISSKDLDFIIIFLSKSFGLDIEKHHDELLVKKK